MTEIPAFFGLLDIVSLALTANSIVGINDNGQNTVPVLLNQPGVIWNITSQPDDQGLRFSTGRFPYTGVDNETAAVISTLEASEDVQWYASYMEAQNAYIIEAGYDRSLVWTVSDPSDLFSPIVVSALRMVIIDPEGPRYLTNQLFNPNQFGLD